MHGDFSRFISPCELQKEMLCYSDGMGYTFHPDFRIDRQSFDNYVVMHTMAGRLICCQNGEKIAAAPGESILMDLHKPHLYYFDTAPSRIAWAHLNGAPVTLLLQKLAQHTSLPRKIRSPEVLPALERLFELSDRPDPNIFAQSAQGYALLMLFLEEGLSGGVRENPRRQEFKQEAWHLIAHNLHRELTVEELAAGMSLSKYHFIRTFHEAFGLPPLQFILQEKIRRAQYRLACTPETVTVIAESLGFSSPGYFARVFRKETGFSPSEYRRRGHLEQPEGNRTYGV